MRLRSLVELRYQAFTITLATVSITFKNATERTGFEISGVAARDYRIFLFFILCFVLPEVSLIITLLSGFAVLFFASLFHMRIFFCYSISSSRCVIVIVRFLKFIRSIVVCSV